MLCAIVLWGLGNSLVSPGINAYAADVAPPGARAQALSLQRQAADTAFLIGPLGLGFLAEQISNAAALELSATFTIGSAAIFWARAGAANDALAPQTQARAEPEKAES